MFHVKSSMMVFFGAENYYALLNPSESLVGVLQEM